ncbi:MAG: DUF4868 domain-containing protein [Candidatus Brocadia sp. WS118]|nr:MAG: DUF4868 domain-containing protein [Candidatus Brocadia sp. WS118]
MTKAQLDESLQYFYQEEGIGISIYFLIKDEDDTSIKRADIEEAAQPEILNQFLEFAQKEIIEDEDLNILKLSSSDERTNVIYQYDLDDIPLELHVIDKVLQSDDHPDLNFNDEDLSFLQGFVILIGNNEHQLVLYKKHHPISLYKRDRPYYFKLSDTRLVKLDADILKLTESFEFFKIDGELFIVDLKTLERFFGFHEVIKKKAQEGMKMVETMKILENPEELSQLLTDVTFARKMVKIVEKSPVLGEIPSPQIIEFTRTHPALRQRFQYSEDGTKIKLHTKSSKNLFLKLLNDDYLHSELTKLYYDSFAKDKIKTEANNEI